MIEKRTMKQNALYDEIRRYSTRDPVASGILSASEMAKDIIRKAGYIPESV